eukprot:1356656-Alexandrium_andersonii.AAC.1
MDWGLILSKAFSQSTKTMCRDWDGLSSMSSIYLRISITASRVLLLCINPYCVCLTEGPRARCNRAARMRAETLYAASSRLMGL